MSCSKAFGPEHETATTWHGNKVGRRGDNYLRTQLRRQADGIRATREIQALFDDDVVSGDAKRTDRGVQLDHHPIHRISDEIHIIGKDRECFLVRSQPTEGVTLTQECARFEKRFLHD